MFFLTRERQEVFDAAFIYPFDEPFDAEFEEDLYEDLTRNVKFFPKQFHSAIMNRTLFLNKNLMETFREWCNETIEQFSTKSNEIYDKREAIVNSFNSSVQRIFSQSLHDGKILNAAQQGNQFILLLDMSGGFTVESIVQLIFHEAQTEGKLEGYYVYDELIKTEYGFGLRVLSSYGRPYEEWTIFFKDVSANYLYRPAVYSELGEISTWNDYVAALDREDNYYIVKHNAFVEIDLDRLSETDEGIFANEEWIGHTFEEAKERIYCATYENPYAHFSEPVPMDELMFALFDPEETIRVRAFNTIFELGEEVATIVNDALRKVDVGTDVNMYFDILASHFDKLGCLEDDVKLKWIT